jgi:two-component system, cell cycle sensor histidine kinase and response regulator CckA
MVVVAPGASARRVGACKSRVMSHLRFWLAAESGWPRSRSVTRAMPQPAAVATLGPRPRHRQLSPDSRSRWVEIHERQRQFLIDNLTQVVWSVVDGGTAFASPNIETVCGFTAREAAAWPGTLWVDRVHPADRERVERAFDALAPGDRFEAECRWQRKDSTWIWVRCTATASRDDGARVVDGLLSDITAQKTLEHQVCQSQKLGAIGQLTGGIAHDFKNLLTVILGSGQFLLETIPKGAQPRIDAEAIVEAAERAAALTKQLLAFSRRHTPEPQVVNLNTVVVEIEKILRRVIGEDIQLSIATSNEVGSVWADPVQVEQVVMNLVVNARDAMPRGGRLAIETVDIGPDDQYVMLGVSDTGCGMDAETRARIFEPLFTTKDQGKGTGLGLSTCRGIVQQAGGFIDVYSEPGQGSAFKVYLPKIGCGAPIAAGARSADGPAGRGGETILALEDNDGIRVLVRRILERLGYRVLEARSGDEALTIFDAAEDPIHLVLSDVVVPGVSGPDVVMRVRERSKSTRALFMSGYTGQTLLQKGTLRAGDPFIQKPFLPAALARKVREVLDA